MKNLTLIILLIAVISCSSNTKKSASEEKEATTTYSLELVWESDTVVKTPESVLYDRNRDVLYVSNINMEPWGKDGNGFISKMGLDGKIVDLKWIEGLNAPKGMGVSGNYLYIADIDVLVQADIESGMVLESYAVEGNPQLNDVTVSEDGTVFVSGSGSSTIYELVDGKLEVFQVGGEGERYNGLFWEKDRMLLITSATSQFKEINLENKEVKILSENMGHGDGIAPVGDGGYITSSWLGAIFYVSKDGVPTKLMDTEKDGIYTADIDYSIEKNLLFVPTFFDNKVKAYKLVKKTE